MPGSSTHTRSQSGRKVNTVSGSSTARRRSFRGATTTRPSCTIDCALSHLRRARHLVAGQDQARRNSGYVRTPGTQSVDLESVASVNQAFYILALLNLDLGRKRRSAGCIESLPGQRGRPRTCESSKQIPLTPFTTFAREYHLARLGSPRERLQTDQIGRPHDT